MVKIDRNADTHERHRRNWQRLDVAVRAGSVSNLTFTGDVTGTGSGSITLTIPDDTVTLAKMADIATDQRLIGRDSAGSDEPTLILATGGIVFTGSGGLQTSAFTGDVTKTLGGTVLTLATVNSNVGGPFNTFTTNGKGLILSATNNTYTTTTIANDPIWTTKGQIVGATGAAAAAVLNVGLVNQVVVPDGTQITGLRWGTLVDPNSIGFQRTTESNTSSKNTLLSSATRDSATVTLIAASGTPFHNREELQIAGYYSSANAGDTLTFTGNVTGGTAGGTVTAMGSIVLTMAGTESNVPFILDMSGAWRTAGVSGTADGWLRLMVGSPATVYMVVPTADTTINTTGTVNNFKLAYQWSTGRVGNTITRTGTRSYAISNGKGF